MARKFKVLRVVDDILHEVERSYKVDAGKPTEKDVAFAYILPKDAECFKKLVARLSGEDLVQAYQYYWYGLDLAARGGERPREAVRSTIIRIKGKDTDLLSLPLPKVCSILTGALAQKELGVRVPNLGAFEYTLERLQTDGKVVVKNGVVSPK